MKRKTDSKGYSLTEIMIVVGVVLLIAGLAIPNLLRSRVFTQEAIATATLHAISSGQMQYRATSSNYATFAQLSAATPPYIPAQLSATGIAKGYNFTVTPNGGANFFATASPQVLAQAHTFYIDEEGLLCRSNSENTAAPGGHIGNGCPVGFTEAQ